PRTPCTRTTPSTVIERGRRVHGTDRYRTPGPAARAVPLGRYSTTRTVVPAVPKAHRASPSSLATRMPPVRAPGSAGGGEEPSTALEKAMETPDRAVKY